MNQRPTYSTAASSETIRPAARRMALLLALIACLVAAPAAFGAKKIAPENPANPWDHLGYLHNVGLDRMAQEIASVDAEPRPGDASFLAWRAALDVAEASYGPVHVAGLPLASLADAAAFRDTEYPMLNDLQRSYLERLADIASAPGLTPQEKIHEFIIIEVEIEARLAADEAMPVLVGAAVGRYSTAYWNSQDADTSTWNLYPDTDSFELALGNTDQIIEADVRGAVLAFVGGPEGMIAGGIITSGIALLGSIWDYFF